MTCRLFLFLSFATLALANGFVPPAVGGGKAFVLSRGGSSSSALNMASEVKVGDKIPSVVLMEGQPDYEKPKEVNLADLIAGKKVAIFAVPGAFTPVRYRCFWRVVRKKHV